MKKPINRLIIGAGMTLLLSCSDGLEPPRADKRAQKLKAHGHERIDDYYWLREREDPEVIAYLNAENGYRERVMAPFQPLQDELFEEMRRRIKEDDATAPARLGDYWYYQRYEQGREYPLYCRKKGSLHGDEEILLDVNELAHGQEFCAVRGFKMSPDQRIISYAVDFVGRRKYTLRFVDVASGDYLADEITETTENFEWANDNRTIFYARLHPETLRSEKIYKHVLGEKEDELIYFETDETFYTSVGKTLSRDYLTITNESILQTEVLTLRADIPEGRFEPFLQRENGHEYYIEHGGDCWYILSNDQAKNFKLMKAPETKNDKSHWIEVVPHRDNVLLHNFTVFKNHVVVEEVSQALPHIRILDRTSGETHELDCAEPLYVARVADNLEYETAVVRYAFQSLKTPASIFDYNMRTRHRELVKQQPVLGGFDADNYTTERLWAKANDGADIPISLLYRKDLERNGRHPLLLGGYGSYGISSSPYFDANRLSLVDRGFIYAIAHVRGGSEMGRSWYEDGRQQRKKNTFTDFIDCAKFLIAEGYTSSAHAYAQGGSAGGLLMGAIANMAPELFNGIIAAVPFVDVITTMLDETIPLTTSEYDEWGNPNDKECYDYMLSYSPYDNVAAQDYPNMLITAGLHDSQVQYWEPAKWAAKLRALKTDDNLLLLYTNMEAGHGGASGRFEALKEDAMQYTFLLALEGIEE